MQYDALNRLRKEIRPMTEETAYWYDEAGNLEQKQDAKGQTTTYTYNDADQLTQISYAGGKIVTFTYDRGGHLETYNDGTTSATYTYDDLGRKLSEMVNYGAFSKTFSYTYYPNGQKQSFTMPGGSIYEYTYHDNNDVKTIRIPGVGDIAYPSYTLNRPDSVTFPGGSQQTYIYDDLMRLERIVASASSLDYQYTYDNMSNILTKQTEHGNYGYGYDEVYRLMTADNPVLYDEAYTYDGVGNRETVSGVSGSITHNANNELTVYGEIAYEYDANGNMIRKSIGAAAINYIYDAANRLVKVEDDATQTVIAEYYYDPFGRRLWKDVGGTRTYFLYADEGLVAEYDETGTELRSYGYQLDSVWTTDPLWLKIGASYYWYQNDHLGTPQKLTAQDGTVVWLAQYTAFGEADVQVETVVNNLRFPGQFFDEETGLHYNFQRSYDPVIGRYLQADPIGFVGRDVNLYAYVWNNPVNWVDPWGLKALVCYNKEKNSVGIILPLQYTGPGAKDPNVIKKFNIGISETWTGQFGKYNVTLYAISDDRAKKFTKFPNTIYVPQGKQLSSTVAANVCGVGGSKGNWPAQISEQTAAHEAGHLMNLDDRYDAYIFPDNTVICYPKKEEWKGSIMALP